MDIIVEELQARLSLIIEKILQLPVMRELHARRLLFPVILGLSVIIVLLLGALQHDSPERMTPRLEIALPPIDVPGLRPDLEKAPLTYVSDYWKQLAENVENKLVLLGPEKSPGIVVAPGVALTSIAAAHELLELEAADPEATRQQSEFPVEAGGVAPAALSQRLLGVDAALGLALFAIKQPDSIGTFVSVPPGRMPAGSYVAAVSLSSDGRIRITPGHVVSLRPAVAGESEGTRMDVAIPFPLDYQAAALVDLDGALAGVAVRSGGVMKIYTTDMIPSLVDRLAHGEGCQAIEVADLSDEARRKLGVSGGVFVENVVEEAFAPAPSILEGDILLMWNGLQVPSAEEYAALYRSPQPGALVRYRVWRNGRAIAGATRMPGPSCRPVSATEASLPTLGITLDWQEPAWVVAHVLEESPAARAGLRRGDEIISVNGREPNSRNLAAFRQFESSGSSLALSVRQEGRVRLVMIEPEPNQSPDASPGSTPP